MLLHNNFGHGWLGNQTSADQFQSFGLTLKFNFGTDDA
jgi:hypothetical protein